MWFSLINLVSFFTAHLPTPTLFSRPSNTRCLTVFMPLIHYSEFHTQTTNKVNPQHTTNKPYILPGNILTLFVPGSGQMKCDGTWAETRFRLSTKRTSPFKSAGASVQSTTDSRGVRISDSNADYTMFRGSVKSIGYPLHSPFSPSLPLPSVTLCHHISIGLYPCTLSHQATCSSPSYLCWASFSSTRFQQ